MLRERAKQKEAEKVPSHYYIYMIVYCFCFGNPLESSKS